MVRLTLQGKKTREVTKNKFELYMKTIEIDCPELENDLKEYYLISGEVIGDIKTKGEDNE